MVLNLKKRKSNADQSASKGKFSKTDRVGGVVAKKLRQKPISPKIEKSASDSAKPKLLKGKIAKKAGPAGIKKNIKKAQMNKNVEKPEDSDNTEMMESANVGPVPAKALSKKKVGAPPKVVPKDEDSESDIVDDENEELDEDGTNGTEKEEKAKRPRKSRRQSMREKYMKLKEKLASGDEEAIEMVKNMVASLEKRADQTKTSQRKLNMYKALLTPSESKETVSPKMPRAKKSNVKVNKQKK